MNFKFMPIVWQVIIIIGLVFFAVKTVKETKETDNNYMRIDENTECILPGALYRYTDKNGTYLIGHSRFGTVIEKIDE